MTIRKADIPDIPQIARLLHQVQNVHAAGRPDLFVRGSRKYTDEELQVLLTDAARPVFVYENAGVIEGYVFCVILDPRDPSHQPVRTMYIDDLCVDESARGKGVGRTLFEYAVSYAKQLGCHDLTLNVWTCNPGARAFYEKMGMQVQKCGMELLL